MSISDWELWACANKLILDHQHEAVDEALARADQLAERGDESGRVTWLAIAQRIRAIQAPDGTVH